MENDKELLKRYLETEIGAGIFMIFPGIALLCGFILELLMKNGFLPFLQDKEPFSYFLLGGLVTGTVYCLFLGILYITKKY